MAASASEAILSRLRDQGVRITPARRALVEVLVESDGHLHAEDVAARVQARHPDIHLSTIYRTLDALEEAGVVRHTHVGHGAAVYHVGAVHQHLVCELCGNVVDVPAELLDDLAATLQREYGFALHPGHFALLGRCDHH